MIPRSREDAYAVIERIRQLKGCGLQEGDISQEVLDMLCYHRDFSNRCAAVVTEEIYRSSRVLFELIQNSDDAQYDGHVEPRVHFELTSEALILRCNERGMTSADVEAICDIGASTKKKSSETTGEKGIGFKAVFAWSPTPHIFSNHFSFKFCAPVEGCDNKKAAGYLIPQWVDNFPISCDSGLTMYLPFGSFGSPGIDLFQEISFHHLIFLRKLVRIDMTCNAKTKSLVRVIEPIAENATWVFVRSKCADDHNREVVCSTLSFAVVSVSAPVPRQAQVERRAHTDAASLKLAFPVDASSGEPCTSADGYVFSCLPILVSGFCFLVQSDFLLTANREDLKVDSPWNIWLRSLIPHAFSIAIEQVFATDTCLSHSYFAYLPHENQVSNCFFNQVVFEVRQKLGQQRCIPTVDGTWHRPQEVLLIDDEAAKLFDSCWLEKVLGLKSIDFMVNLDLHQATLENLGCRKLSNEELLRCLQHEAMLEKKSLGWFQNLYAYLATHIHEVALAESFACQASIFPLQGGGRVSLQDGPVMILKDSVRTSRQEQDMLCKLGVQILHCDTGTLGTVQCHAPAVVSWLLQAGLIELSPAAVVERQLLPVYARKQRHLSHESLLVHLHYISNVLKTPATTNCLSDEQQKIVELASNGIYIRSQCADDKQLRGDWQIPQHGRIWEEGAESYCLAKYCFLPTSTSLCSLLEGLPMTYFAHEQYEEIDGVEDALRLLGAAERPKLESREEWINYRDRDAMRKRLNIKSGLPYNEGKCYKLILPSFGEHLLCHVYNQPDKARALLELMDKYWESYVEEGRKAKVIYWRKCRNGGGLETNQQLEILVDFPPQELVKGLKDQRFQVFTKSRQVLPLRECYLQSNSLENIFGDDLPYLGMPLKQEFQMALGLHAQLDVNALLTRLRQISQTDRLSTSQLKAVERIYMCMTSMDGLATEAIRKTFEVEPLLMVRQRGNHGSTIHVAWRRTSEVRWTDNPQTDKHLFQQSAENAKNLEFLEDSYPESLKCFFHEKVGVLERPQFVDMADALYSANHDSAQQLYLKLSKEIARLQSRQRECYKDWYTKAMFRLCNLVNEPVLLLKDGRWVCACECDVLLPDDEEVLAALGGSASGTLALLDVQPEHTPLLADFRDCFQLELLSSSARATVDESCSMQYNGFWTNWIRTCLPYIARCVHHILTRDAEDDPKPSSEIVMRWTGLEQALQCYIVDNLHVKVQFDTAALTSIPSVKRQVHLEGSKIYIDRACLECGVSIVGIALNPVLLQLLCPNMSRSQSEDPILCSIPMLLAQQSTDLLDQMFKMPPLRQTAPLPKQLLLSLKRRCLKQEDEQPRLAGVVSPEAHTVQKPAAKKMPKRQAAVAMHLAESCRLARPSSNRMLAESCPPARPTSNRMLSALGKDPVTTDHKSPCATAKCQQQQFSQISQPLGKEGVAETPTASSTSQLIADGSILRPSGALTRCRQQCHSSSFGEDALSRPVKRCRLDSMNSAKEIVILDPGGSASSSKNEDATTSACSAEGDMPSPPVVPHCFLRSWSAMERLQAKLKPTNRGRASTATHLSESVPSCPRWTSDTGASSATAFESSAVKLPETSDAAWSLSDTPSQSGELENIQDQDMQDAVADIDNAESIASSCEEQHQNVDTRRKNTSARILGKLRQRWHANVEAMGKVLSTLWVSLGGRNAMNESSGRVLAVKEAEVPVADVCFSHTWISSKFGQGEHQGQEIASLVEALHQGKVHTLSDDRLILKTAIFQNRLISMNNRRLYAMKQYQTEVGPLRTVKVRVRIFDLCPITAKFLLAYDPEGDGETVKVRR